MKNEDILTSGFEVNGENRRMGMLTKACKLFSSRFRIFWKIFWLEVDNRLFLD